MSIFVSDRERRLWLWTAAMVAAIYATLGLTRPLAGKLRAFGLLELAFGLALILAGIAVVVLALKTRPSGAEIGVGLGVAAVYLLLFVRMEIPEERTHLIEYGVVAAFIYAALTERASHGRAVPAPALLAIGLAALIGGLDEVIQAFLPGRIFEPRDILFNVLAASMAVLASVALAWARRRSGR